MGLQRKSSLTRALEGIHGVRLVPHSPFPVQEISRHGDSKPSTCEGYQASDTNQGLIIRKVYHVNYWDQIIPVQKENTPFPVIVPSVHRKVGDIGKPSLRAHPFSGDQTLTETFVNVLTSLPFIALGIQAPRKNKSSALYANSLIGVGVTSSLYHSSRGELRKYLRWADYAMIATATVCLSRTLRNENPKVLMAASAFCLPFQPLMVSAVHTGMMEVAFARRALTKPDLRTAHNLHTMSSLLGAALFIADDCFPGTPYIHAAWHLAAAVGVGTCNKLLE